jgi:type VI secretion system protein ImpJ
LRLRLMPASADRTGYECLGVARVAQVQANGVVELDRRYAPPSLHVKAAPALVDRLTELEARIVDQADRLQEIVVRPREAGTSTVANFLLLQLLNRLQPVVTHHAGLGLIHPESLYGYLLGAAGELATFSLGQEGRRPKAFPTYRHDDLASCFHPVMDAIMESLGEPIVQPAVPIPLREHSRGVRTANVTDRALLDDARFYLAVRAAVPAEILRRRFPEQAKLGPAYRLEELVQQKREGIAIELAPSAPREIPFHVDAMYFWLRSDNELYREFQKVGQLAIHVTQEFPDLQLECWAIRGFDR